jgi:hypothetical protein
MKNMNEVESNVPRRRCTAAIAAFREVWRRVSLLFIFTALLTPNTVHARFIPDRTLHDIAKYARCLRSNAIPGVDFHTRDTIRNQCLHVATPVVCRGGESKECLACIDAGWWSSTFGDCSTSSDF